MFFISFKIYIITSLLLDSMEAIKNSLHAIDPIVFMSLISKGFSECEKFVNPYILVGFTFENETTKC